MAPVSDPGCDQDVILTAAERIAMIMNQLPSKHAQLTVLGTIVAAACDCAENPRAVLDIVIASVIRALPGVSFNDVPEPNHDGGRSVH